MDEINRAVRQLVDDVNQEQQIEERFLNELKQHTKILKGLIVFLLLLAVGTLGMILYSMRSKYPSAIDNVVFVVQLSLLLSSSLLISNWLRIAFQHKIDHANAHWYRNGWSK